MVLHNRSANVQRSKGVFQSQVSSGRSGFVMHSSDLSSAPTARGSLTLLRSDRTCTDKLNVIVGIGDIPLKGWGKKSRALIKTSLLSFTVTAS